MKLRAPNGCVSLSHHGRVVAVAADGSVEVDDDLGPALAAHGFGPWPEAATAEAGMELSQRGSGASVPPTMQTEDIERLNRPSLFAFLREKGVPVSLPITNHELRALARQAARA